MTEHFTRTEAATLAKAAGFEVRRGLGLRESVPEDVFAHGLINEEVTALCNAAAVAAKLKGWDVQGAAAKCVWGGKIEHLHEGPPSKLVGALLYTHALPAQPAEPAKDAGLVADGCVWTQDSDFEMGDTYDSGCGEKWSFIEGGPKENNVRFCQGCGKPVVIASAQPQQKEG